MTGSHARQHGPWLKILADNLLAGRDYRERARGRNAERMHRFADEVLAQHGPKRCASVAIARERRPSRALELDVAPHAVASHPLTEQDGATITELRHEAAKLMTRVGQSDRVGIIGRLIA